MIQSNSFPVQKIKDGNGPTA